MSLHRIYSHKKSQTSEKAPSAPVRIAAACIVIATIGVVLKSGYEFIGVVSDIQHTVGQSAPLPSEAEGAFYFIEPAKTATL